MTSPSSPEPRRPSSSSPSDTRSRAAADLTEQGRENQRPYGERSDASSVVQSGSSRDGSVSNQDGEGPSGASRPPPAAGPQAQTDKRIGGNSMLDEENPADPRERS